jgi:hypothetical protein
MCWSTLVGTTFSLPVDIDTTMEPSVATTTGITTIAAG